MQINMSDVLLYELWCETKVIIPRKVALWCLGGTYPGGGGHSGTEGGRTFVTYFAEEGVFL